MQARVAVVFHEPLLQREDGVVAAHADVFAGEPEGAALAEDDVAGDYVFVCGEKEGNGAVSFL